MNDLFMKKYYASVESHDGTQSFHAERIQVKSIQLLCVNNIFKVPVRTRKQYMEFGKPKCIKGNSL